MSATDYWNGHAPGYSRAVAIASQSVYTAKDALLATLKREYPKGARVRVVHHRGAFGGTVVGWDADGARVLVVNDRSGKAYKWWAAQVEVMGGST